jgi:hypothetical protein
MPEVAFVPAVEPVRRGHAAILSKSAPS